MTGTVSSSPDQMGSGATHNARNDSKESSKHFQQKLNDVLEPVTVQTGSRSNKQMENIQELREAIVELYLAIKIRSTEEVGEIFA